VSVIIKDIAQRFAIREEELLRQSLRAFLQDELHVLEVERRARCAKFGVSSLEEFDRLLIERPDEESQMLEDFQRVDYLTHRIEEIKQLMKEV
jgi:hypothetical protein